MSKWNSAGAVVVSADGLKVLLRRPVQNPGYEGGWTHAKGGVDAGESLPMAALREVREETGAEVDLAGQLPGEWEGEYSVTTYFLARFRRIADRYDHETEAVQWFTWAEAAVAIAAGVSAVQALRDLAVLDLARGATEAWRDAALAPVRVGQVVRIRNGCRGEGYRFVVAAVLGHSEGRKVCGEGYGPVPVSDVEIL